MPIQIPPVSSGHVESYAMTKAIVDATETVDSYCIDYLVHDGSTVDRDYLRSERVDHVQRTLAELDAIVELEQRIPIHDEGGLWLDSIRRARALAAAIREALVKS